MVAICAGVPHVEPWAAAVIGMIASLVYTGWSNAMLRLKIDDPLDAVAVHLGCGIWGTLAAPMFASNPAVEGIFYMGRFYTFGINVAGIVAIVAWTLVLSAAMFLVLKLAGILRLSEASELLGSDQKKHKEPAYPYQPFDEDSILGSKSVELKNRETDKEGDSKEGEKKPSREENKTPVPAEVA